MQKTICDKCGIEIKNSIVYWAVRMDPYALRTLTGVYIRTARTESIEKDLCDKCGQALIKWLEESPYSDSTNGA
jgi:hypothetical protein